LRGLFGFLFDLVDLLRGVAVGGRGFLFGRFATDRERGGRQERDE
jgi:hypothetical protein